MSDHPDHEQRLEDIPKPKVEDSLPPTGRGAGAEVQLAQPGDGGLSKLRDELLRQAVANLSSSGGSGSKTTTPWHWMKDHWIIVTGVATALLGMLAWIGVKVIRIEKFEATAVQREKQLSLHKSNLNQLKVTGQIYQTLLSSLAAREAETRKRLERLKRDLKKSQQALDEAKQQITLVKPLVDRAEFLDQEVGKLQLALKTTGVKPRVKKLEPKFKVFYRWIYANACPIGKEEGRCRGYPYVDQHKPVFVDPVEIREAKNILDVEQPKKIEIKDGKTEPRITATATPNKNVVKLTVRRTVGGRFEGLYMVRVKYIPKR